jgi:GT2 family glycosyltransferase
MSKQRGEGSCGVLLGAEQGVVYGWAMDPAGEPLVIELEGDGTVIALARSCMVLPADIPLPSPQHRQRGFIFHLGDERLATFGCLKARIANRDARLAHSWLQGEIYPAAMAPAAAPDHLWAAVQHHALAVEGWFLPEAFATGPERVLAFVEHRCIANAEPRPVYPQEEAQGAPQGSLYFSLSLPLSLADGQRHSVKVLTSAGRELPGSPFEVWMPGEAQTWVATLPIAPADKTLLSLMLGHRAAHEPASVPFADYPAWQARFGTPPAHQSKLRVLVVIGPHAAPGAAVSASLQSLLAQRHTHWEALVWEGANLTEDPRVHPVPARRWRKALREALSRHAWVGVLPAGDVWHPELLCMGLHHLEQGARLTYCDADDCSGGPPWFKPDWCPETFLSLPLLAHGFLCARTLLADAAADPLDWPTQAVITLGGSNADGIVHLPFVLHTRGDGLAASTPLKKADATGADVLCSHLLQSFDLKHWQPATHHEPSRWSVNDPPHWPEVTVIIPTRDGESLLRNCIESLSETDYPRMKVWVVDNQSTCSSTLAYMNRLEAEGIRVIRWPHAFNYAALHNDVMRMVGTELIALMNNDVRAMDRHWLKHLVRGLHRPRVGAAGAKLLWPNGMVQHGGVVLGLHGAAGHIGNLWRAEDAGYHQMNRITRTVSAVTAACLVMRTVDYLEVGGMDASAYPVAFNDVDLCLKLKARGKRSLWCAEAVLEHAESMSRGQDNTPARRARAAHELQALQAHWQTALVNDPYYNPNLNLDSYSHARLAMPPRHVQGKQ